MVGRFEDGTPVTLQEGDGMHKPVPNNFNYASDAGGRCPFIGHVRKVNPRDGSERTRLLARRGITYGHRAVHPSDNPTFEQMPTGDVGLLFMCFQANITNQFEFVQGTWANNKNFPVPNSGIDPVIGQGPSVPPQHWPKEWGDAAKTGSFDFSHFVTMKGGEYFFAPSLGFLTTLA